MELRIPDTSQHREFVSRIHRIKQHDSEGHTCYSVNLCNALLCQRSQFSGYSIRGQQCQDLCAGSWLVGWFVFVKSEWTSYLLQNRGQKMIYLSDSLVRQVNEV